MPPTRFVSADEAAAAIPDGATVAVSGSGGGVLEPDAILAAVERRFLSDHHPGALTLVHAFGIGDGTRRGTNRFAHPGMTRRVIGGHWSWSPRLMAMARAGEIEAYAWPSGAISLLLREIGARRPGLVSRTGIDTFVDPRQAGGSFHGRPGAMIEVVEVDGTEYLRYKAFPVDVAVIRGGSADRHGNISCAGEAAQLDVLAAAQAARASGGLVIAQVKTVVDRPLDPTTVQVPGPLVDLVVQAPDQWQTYAGEFDPGPASLSGDELDDLLRGTRGLIAARAAREVSPGDVVNLGFGVSAHVADVLAASGRVDEVTLAVEQGMFGGRPLSGDLFGVVSHPWAVLPSTAQFDLFAGGILDVCLLGMAQVDESGSVNVSLIGGDLVGPGGFIDISQNARTAVFCGTFTTKGMATEVSADRLRIVREGSVQKFVRRVDQVTFSGPLALREGRTARYITERAVFELTPEGVELTEVAPGIDIDRDIVAAMGFRPVIRAPRVGILPVPRHSLA